MGSTTQDPSLLTCWKDIARYMGKGVRTVQRWEQKLDMPVRRPRGSLYKSAVVARPSDLDVWLAARWSGRDPQETPTDAGTRRLTNPDMINAIQTAHELRAANHALALELSSGLQKLMQSCDEIQRQGKAANSK